jgi:hypothetical protein
MKIHQGDSVEYHQPNGKWVKAICIGNGWNKGRRIVFLDTGTWCYRDDVIEATKSPKTTTTGAKPKE